MLTQRTTNPKTLKPELNEHLHSISNDFICTTKCSAKSTKHMKKPSTFFPPHIKLKQKKPTAKSKPQMLTHIHKLTNLSLHVGPPKHHLQILIHLGSTGMDAQINPMSFL